MMQILWKLSLGAVLGMVVWLLAMAVMLEVLATQEEARLKKPVAKVRVVR
jgi:hypothetical protein